MDKKPLVIIVNDDPAQLDIISTSISQDEIEVASFTNAQKALKYIAERDKIDLVISDLYMPIMDGWSFCRQLRSPEMPHTNYTPILVISATYAGDNPQAIIRDIGANAFLAAPYRVQELRSLVQDMLRRQPKKQDVTVLVVECDHYERRRLVEGFTLHGYQVIEAGDAAAARERIRTPRINIVFLSHHPPQVPADQLLREFAPICREQDAITIVALPDSAEPSWSTDGPPLADVYVHRPIHASFLIDMAVKARRERTILQLEGVLEARTRESLRNAERIQQFNQVFLSLGSNIQANIQTLTRMAGELLGAVCALYQSRDYLVGLHWEPGRFEVINRPLSQQPGSLYSELIGRQESSPLLVHHLADTPYARHDLLIRHYDLHTLIGCPVVSGNNRTGALCLFYSENLEPASEDIKIIQMLGRAIGQQEQIAQRNRELSALNEIGRIVTSTLSLDDMLSLLRDKTRDVLNAEACSIALVDPQTGELVFHQAHSNQVARMIGQRLQPGQGIAGWVAQTGRSLLVQDAYTDSRFYPGIDASTGFVTRQVLCVPLIAQNKTIGVLEVFNNPQFSDQDMRFAESIAAQAASAIENVRLHEVTRQELNERIKMERALRESERRLRTFIDASPDLISLKDANLKYLMVNRAMERFMGVSQSEIIGRNGFQLMPREMAETCHQTDQQAVQSGQLQIRQRWLGDRLYELHKIPVFNEHGQIEGVAGMIRDVTEQKRLDEQIAQRQKAESLLILTAGVAHVFRNQLTVIIGNVDLFQQGIVLQDEAAQMFYEMEQAAQTMKEKTDQLLDFVGISSQRAALININDIVDLALGETRPHWESQIAVELNLEDRLWEIDADSRQIDLLLNNLIVNACEAMEERNGILSISTANVFRPAWESELCGWFPQGYYVRLTIEDTGKGMTEEVKKNIFVPFFTDKTTLPERGLGLPTVLGITRQHNGSIHVSSEVGQGTRIELYFPPSSKTSWQSTDLTPASRPTILVLEPEFNAAYVLQHALTSNGYAVLLVQNDRQIEQIAACRPNKKRAAILNLDALLSAGREWYDLWRLRYPDIPILIIGTSLVPHIPSWLGTPPDCLFARPYSTQSLVETLRRKIYLVESGAN